MGFARPTTVRFVTPRPRLPRLPDLTPATDPRRGYSHVHVTAADRAVLQADHSRQLAAFLTDDAEALLAATEAHHARLNGVLAGLPTDRGLFAEPED